MNTEKFAELESKASESLVSRMQALREQADQVIHEQVETMKASGAALELSDDEERMLRAYKAFVRRTKPGAVFSWKTPVVPAAIVTPDDVSIILDPQDVSGQA